MGAATIVIALIGLSVAAFGGGSHPVALAAAAGESKGGAVSAESSLHSAGAIYTDGFQNGWTDWSWVKDRDVADRQHARPGGAGVCVRLHGGGFAGFFPRSDAFDVTPYDRLFFRASGGAVGGQSLKISGLRKDKPQGGTFVGPLSANHWKAIAIALQTLKVTGSKDVTGFWFQIYSQGDSPEFYVEDIRLLHAGEPAPQ